MLTKILVNTLPFIFILGFIFKAYKIPLIRIYAFENYVKLWLIHIILLIVPTGLWFHTWFKNDIEESLIPHIHRFIDIHSQYGLLTGITYIVPWILYILSFILPPLAVLFFIGFSSWLTRLKEKLIPLHNKRDVFPNFKEAIPFFESKMVKIIKQANLTVKPAIYIRKNTNPNCYTFGTKNNPNIVITSGLLESINNKSLTTANIESIIWHEIGHILNGDLRLASSIRIFSNLRIMELTVLSTFIGVVLIYLTNIAFGFLIKKANLGNILKYLIDLKQLIIIFFIFYFLVFLLDMLIRILLKTREYFADAYAAKLTNRNMYINTLINISFSFDFLESNSFAFSGLPNHGLLLFPMSILTSLLKVLLNAKALSKKMRNFISNTMENLERLFHTHPSLKERVQAIENRTYFPLHPVLISFKNYLTLGITIFLTFLFLLVIALKLSPSGWTFFLYLTCSLVALVIINNSHLRFLKKYELSALSNSFMQCGFRITPPKLKTAGRKLFYANHLALLPFILTILFFYFLPLKEKPPLTILATAISLPFMFNHLCTNFFLIFLSRFKKDT